MTKYFKIIILFFTLHFFLSAILYGQARFEHLSLSEGLSQSTVYCILKGNRGLMWFGTHNGLHRYDGKNIKTYNHQPDDPNSLSNNYTLLLIT